VKREKGTFTKGKTNELHAGISRREFLKYSGAVGVAVLKALGSNDQIMRPKIIEQKQIARAVELGLGAASPLNIELVAADNQSVEYRNRVVQILNRG